MKELIDKFFKENPVDSKTPSAAALAHFRLIMESKPESDTILHEKMDELIYKFKPEREAESLPERKEIESATSPEQVIRFMRRHTDAMNQRLLIDKALEFEDELISEIVSRLKTSLNDGFIELSIRVLAKSKTNVAEQLAGYYDDMRHPYAQSMVLVLLGFIADESYIPWIIEKYSELKRLYPNESYCEGASYALYEIENRFYPTGKQKKKLPTSGQVGPK